MALGSSIGDAGKVVGAVSMGLVATSFGPATAMQAAALIEGCAAAFFALRAPPKHLVDVA